MKKILQVFKKLFKPKNNYKPPNKIYICDPSKNKKCTKDSCWDINEGECRCTSHKEFAKLDNNKRPIIATDSDIYNLDYIEKHIDPKNFKDFYMPEKSQKKQGL